MSNIDQHTELRSRLAQVRRRWTRLGRMQTAGRALAAAAVPMLVAAAVIAGTGSDGGSLLLLIVAALLAAVAALTFALWTMPRRPQDRQVARFIEERASALPAERSFHDTLVSAVDAAGSPDLAGRDVFLPLLVEDALRRLRGIDPAEIVTPQAMRLAGGCALGGVVMLAAALTAGAPSIGRAIETVRLRYFPGSVVVAVTPGSVRIPAGTPVRIHTVLRGSSGELTRIIPGLTVTAGGQRRTVPMVAARDGFDYTFESVDRTFSYTVTAGSVRSSDYTVTALTPPRVSRIDLHYEYPAFAGLGPRDEEDGGDIYAPAGTRVRLRIHTDKPVAEGHVALGGSPALAVRAAGDRVVEADLVVGKNDAYRVRLSDADGLQSGSDAEYFIRLMDDRPPAVRILRPSADQPITPLEETLIEARADDDYGIAALDLVYAVAGRQERIVPFDRISGTDVQRIGTRLLSAEELGVKPGDVISYYARARDIGRGRRATEATSDIFFLEVKPFNEEFEAAESQAGAGAGTPQLDSLIEAQKAIIASTWNIERRAQAGRSAADVKAVAAAQAELKARVEQINPRSMRSRGRAPVPQRPAQAARASPRGADAIGAAVDAMSRALEQLTTDRTKEALPHEMAALNGLLQAQAEVRRMQVAQQNSGPGSGGGNRQGQDLSALFDKELQRQQRTNYETQSAVETRPDQEKTAESALDRIRDLARRQEDLSRRQRELAHARVTAEEMKRQLEKLTREQTELGQQAEDLARKVEPPRPTQNGRQSSSSGTASAAGELHGATEQMQSAASELRRDDPNAAAQSGQRAAEQLRRLEQQMRGGNADAGNVQREAQQIAQEQRRIAGEAERLDKSSGEVAADARRRLADEKDRLAGRVDELQRSTRQLGQRTAGATSSNGKSADGAAMGAAAREIERQRISQRMRDTAKQMRAPQSPVERSARGAESEAGAGPGKGGTARVEQEIARDLDRVAGSLDTAASAETRQLSNQLDQTRAIRDRLARLEQQIRDA
ncbi:MAG: DUF4175 family protein, partial [Acidobacteriota bacterium]